MQDTVVWTGSGHAVFAMFDKGFHLDKTITGSDESIWEERIPEDKHWV